MSSENADTAVVQALVETSPPTEVAVVDPRRDLWNQAVAMSKSQLVPKHFQHKPEDCFIMADLALRLGTPLLPTLQGTYIVHGKPGFEGKFVAALLEGSGKIVGPIDYEFDGDGDDYGCRAVVHDQALNKLIRGPKVDWRMVKAERWDQKEGSKWKSLPELMFHYRAVSFLVRTRYPSVLMGMNTREELDDLTIDVPATQALTSDLEKEAAEKAADARPADKTPQPETPPDDANVDQETADMQDMRLEEYRQAIEQCSTPLDIQTHRGALEKDTVLNAQQIAGLRRSLTARAKKLEGGELR